MADIPRAFDMVNRVTVPNDLLGSGPRTPWSPVREWTRSGPGRVAAAPLLDLENHEAELAAVSRRGNGVPLRLLVLDLLHLVPLDILQLPPGTVYQSLSAMCVTLSLVLNVQGGPKNRTVF